MKGIPVIHPGPIGVNSNMEKHNGMVFRRENFILCGECFASMPSEP